MTVEEGLAGIIRHEIERQFLVSAKHYDILHHARSRLAGDAGQLEGMAVQVEWMDVVARIAQLKVVAASVMNCVDRLERLHEKWDAWVGLSVQRKGRDLDDALGPRV